MTHRAWSALIAASALVLRGPSSGAQQPVFRSTTEVVSVPVSVTRDGRPFSGLNASDFTVLDNGVRQDITEFSSEANAIDMTVVLDFGLRSERSEFVRSTEAAMHLQSGLTASDRLRLVRYGATVDEIVPMRAATEPLPPEAFAPSRVVTGPERLAFDDALFYALAWPADTGRRHVIVLFAEGLDSWSTLEPDLIPRLASRSDAVIQAVILQSVPPQPASAGTGTKDQWISSDGSDHLSPNQVLAWRQGYAAMDAAVQVTGGSLHHINEGPAMLDAVVLDFRKSYVLRYVPHGVAGGGPHEITVKITRPGSFTVRARKGYDN
jgi:VWFA-related protein